MERKYLDKSFDLILRPEKKQVMLDKFCTAPEYAHILLGKTLVEVYTQDKTVFEGTLTLKAHNRVVFISVNPNMPKFEPGYSLLIIPQKKPHLVIVQASVETMIDKAILLQPVDPRRRARYRTRMPASFYGIGQPLFDHLKNHSAKVFREDEMAKPMGAPHYISKALDKVEDHAKVAHDGLQFVGKGRVPHKAVLSDISEGGCCIIASRDAKIDGLQDHKLIFISLELPHPSKSISARVFASVRFIRTETSHLVLHCMFVEPLPQSFLEF